jgi:hypothetical protein
MSPATWNGSWNGSPGIPFVLCAAVALLCSIGAGSGLKAWEHASCKRVLAVRDNAGSADQVRPPARHPTCAVVVNSRDAPSRAGSKGLRCSRRRIRLR